MHLVDAHCHFDFPVFDGRREQVWRRAGEAGVSGLVIPGVRRSDWGRVQCVARQERSWRYCLGIHPWYVAEHHWSDLDLLARELEQSADCVGVGECGLDRLHGSLDEQLPWFEAQLTIARDQDLPLVVHSVRTHDEVAAALRRSPPGVPVLVHGFSGSYQQARTLVDLGCFLGVGGVITHDRARKTRDVFSRLPLDCLVLETDAPDMAPAGVAKGANEPASLRQILICLAELRAQDAGELARCLSANVVRLYRWGAVTGGD